MQRIAFWHCQRTRVFARTFESTSEAVFYARLKRGMMPDEVAFKPSMPRSLHIAERMPLPAGGAVAADQSGLLDRPVLDECTDSLNVRTGAHSGHINMGSEANVPNDARLKRQAEI